MFSGRCSQDAFPFQNQVDNQLHKTAVTLRDLFEIWQKLSNHNFGAG